MNEREEEFISQKVTHKISKKKKEEENGEAKNKETKVGRGICRSSYFGLLACSLLFTILSYQYDYYVTIVLLYSLLVHTGIHYWFLGLCVFSRTNSPANHRAGDDHTMKAYSYTKSTQCKGIHQITVQLDSTSIRTESPYTIIYYSLANMHLMSSVFQLVQIAQNAVDSDAPYTMPSVLCITQGTANLKARWSGGPSEPSVDLLPPRYCSASGKYLQTVKFCETQIQREK